MTHAVTINRLPADPLGRRLVVTCAVCGEIAMTRDRVVARETKASHERKTS